MKIKNRSKICLIISVAIICIAAIMMICGRGFNMGLDFTGGLSMQYDLNPAMSEAGYSGEGLNASAVQADAEAALNAMDVGAFSVTVQGANHNIVNIRLKGFVLEDRNVEEAEAAAERAAEAAAETVAEEATEAVETTAETVEETAETAAETVAEEATEAVEETAETVEETAETAAETVAEEATEAVEETAEAADDSNKEEIQKLQRDFEEKISEKYPDAAVFGDVSYVGPVSGAALQSNFVICALVAIALMLLYIAIRFDFFSGLAAVIGLAHDLLIMLAFMVIFRDMIQMNSSFIAAALTIVGYSINNTIIIFDRIRENVKKLPSESREEITNRSIKESLGRTICTTATTLITIVTLCILGVASIREFALPIIIGIIAGVYSANMINGYIWAFFAEKFGGKGKGKAKA